MRQYKLYLPSESEQDVICQRWKHLFNMIDRENQEVRLYTAPFDFDESDAKYPLPYATLNGEKRSFDSLWDKIMVKTGYAEEGGYTPGNSYD